MLPIFFNHLATHGGLKIIDQSIVENHHRKNTTTHMLLNIDEMEI
jgi:hypothetical protein